MKLLATALLLVTGGLLTSGFLHADINFDNLAEGTVVGNNYAGVTFTNAVVWAQNSFLPATFPPNSPPNVATNDQGGTITIEFAQPVGFVSGFFTYSEPLTIESFDGNGNELTSFTSYNNGVGTYANYLGADIPYPNNFAAPNMYYTVFNANNKISSVEIFTASDQTDTFTLDNLSYNPVPEPALWVPLSALLLAVAGSSRLRRGKTGNPGID
jgi:hypothetical protein